jgi:hypothetical protein
MSQQPRRRRRRHRSRRGANSTQAGAQRQEQKSAAVPPNESTSAKKSSSRSRRRRGRRGRRGPGQPQQSSPLLSEDLVRAGTKVRPRHLTARPDGRSLEGIIGELQSEMGVPQNPQEYMLTIKVAEERENSRAVKQTTVEVPVESDDAVKPDEDSALAKPRREKAPAAPRIGLEGTSEATNERGQRRRRRRRRRGGRPRGGSA